MGMPSFAQAAVKQNAIGSKHTLSPHSSAGWKVPGPGSHRFALWQRVCCWLRVAAVSPCPPVAFPCWVQWVQDLTLTASFTDLLEALCPHLSQEGLGSTCSAHRVTWALGSLLSGLM